MNYRRCSDKNITQSQFCHRKSLAQPRTGDYQSFDEDCDDKKYENYDDANDDDNDYAIAVTTTGSQSQLAAL